VKLFTYHEALPDYPDQTPLLDVWRQSWERQGFECVVLGEEHAAGHRWFADLDGWDFLALSVNAWPYAKACYRRWMAYAQVATEDFRFCDYDVLNVSLKPKDVPVARAAGLWLGDRDAVPCFGVANKPTIEGVIRLFRNAALMRQAGKFCVQDDISDMNLIRDFGDVTKRDLVSLHGDGRRRPLIHFSNSCFPEGNRIQAATEWWAKQPKN
jgi:hypothetical protein